MLLCVTVVCMRCMRGTRAVQQGGLVAQGCLHERGMYAWQKGTWGGLQSASDTTATLPAPPAVLSLPAATAASVQVRRTFLRSVMLPLAASSALHSSRLPSPMPHMRYRWPCREAKSTERAMTSPPRGSSWTCGEGEGAGEGVCCEARGEQLKLLAVLAAGCAGCWLCWLLAVLAAGCAGSWWAYQAGGCTRQVGVPGRWVYQAGGCTRQVGVPGRWVYQAGGWLQQSQPCCMLGCHAWLSCWAVMLTSHITTFPQHQVKLQ
jgi:hypothetical protein